MKFYLRIHIIILTVFTLISCSNSTNQDFSKTQEVEKKLGFTIINIYPHDTTSYTQGLIIIGDTIFESTGLNNKSIIRKTRLRGNEKFKEIKIKDNAIFGEGITVFDKKLYQLTWQNNKAFCYDVNNLKLLKQFSWPYEGWGITNDNHNLIISTGSNILYFVDPISFKIKKQLSVLNNNSPVENLNELEYIGGYVFANKYLTDTIVKIDIKTGEVVGFLDMTGLLSRSGLKYDIEKYNNSTGNVLNGIAYDSISHSLFITGKLWPAFFEIKLNH